MRFDFLRLKIRLPRRKRAHLCALSYTCAQEKRGGSLVNYIAPRLNIDKLSLVHFYKEPRFIGHGYLHPKFEVFYLSLLFSFP